MSKDDIGVIVVKTIVALWVVAWGIFLVGGFWGGFLCALGIVRLWQVGLDVWEARYRRRIFESSNEFLDSLDD